MKRYISRLMHWHLVFGTRLYVDAILFSSPQFALHSISRRNHLNQLFSWNELLDALQLQMKMTNVCLIWMKLWEIDGPFRVWTKLWLVSQYALLSTDFTMLLLHFFSPSTTKWWKQVYLNPMIRVKLILFVISILMLFNLLTLKTLGEKVLILITFTTYLKYKYIVQIFIQVNGNTVIKLVF